MSLHLLPAMSLGARLDEIQRTARELFGSAVTISAETESPYTRSDEEPKPDKAIKVVIKIELPGAFPKLVSEQACPGGRASPAMEIGEPSSRASSSEGACAASSALGPTPFPATTTSSGAPSVSSYENALERCVRDIEDAYTRREPGVAIKAVPSWPIASIIAKHFPYDTDALTKERDEWKRRADAAEQACLDWLARSDRQEAENRELHAARLEADNRVRELDERLKQTKTSRDEGNAIILAHVKALGRPVSSEEIKAARSEIAGRRESASTISGIDPSDAEDAGLQRGPVNPLTELCIAEWEVERWQKHLRERAALEADDLRNSKMPDVVRAAEIIAERIRALPLGRPENQA